MRRYAETRKVVHGDLDELDHVNNIRYIHWIQEISKAHWLSATNATLQKLGIWVVRKHDITYFKSAQLNDELCLVTHVQQMKGPISTRVVEISDNKTGVLLVRAITDWCFLDTQLLRPKRIPETVNKLFQ
ncbi:acyl-CoA thioesterase [Allomuricauda sp. SCSIO 65647]|uniref:acyl-CoA thioesterase n=1 Tax=Allomuricauda sp. SCSIO 65647 TaxID=2908843 RepID=UPI001F1C9BAA|nr:acyl-CoA thioesterase [Muricauda sp. SCSIO 65647]UJH67565.1 acyl-CoA thioesterase [Muricauda sp. SCSIO 65647]